MDTFKLVGQRVSVKSKDGTTSIGLGTYLWNDEILLDTGKKILGKHCSWEVTAPSNVPMFEICLTQYTRVFCGEQNLRNTGQWLRDGDKVVILEIAKRGWNHGTYVAGKFYWLGEAYWFIMSEVELPMETPYLRVVS